MKPPRLAWFSPFPPVKTGIAGRSAELVDVLRGRGYTIDTYPEERAHDFPWRRRLQPYDLAVYQFGNSSHHDYEWPYALRYPGLVVLHDTHLHHARAALLLREKRIDDYRAEFRWSEPDVSPDAAEIAVAGLDSALYYQWPFTRALVEAARLVAVHGEGAAREARHAMRGVRDAARDAEDAESAEKIVSIRLGEGVAVSPEREARARREVRAKYGIPQNAVLFGCFGGLTPEKRVAQIISAFRAIRPGTPDARLLLAGAEAAHLRRGIHETDAQEGRGIHGIHGEERRGPCGIRGDDDVTLTGYLDTDDELTDHIAACDVTLNLRWPTARETSGPWLRALAAGKPTVITDLVHMTDVASLDPRTWRVQEAGREARGAGREDPGSGMRDSHASHTAPPGSPVTIAIDILDEDHSLRLAMRRLASDAELRARLGRAAREYWTHEHTVEEMADDYERVMREAVHGARGAGSGAEGAANEQVPAHLRPAGDEKLRELLQPFGLESPL